jgi:hypothetical protein
MSIVALVRPWDTSAAVIREPLFAVTIASTAASSGADTNIGTHFHDYYFNPEDSLFVAEVGSWGTEQIRAVSEFDLTNIATAAVFLVFDVYALQGIYDDGFGDNLRPFDGVIEVWTYGANGQREIDDYHLPGTALLGTFSTDSLTSPGQVLAFDITSAVNASIAAGDDAIGVRLQIAPGVDPMGGAMTFGDFRLMDPVPEPQTVFCILAGLTGIFVSQRLQRRRRRDAGDHAVKR